MKRAKQLWILAFVAVGVVLCLIGTQVFLFFEKQDCICAWLTTEQQTFEIDDCLRSYLDNLDETGGVWIEHREMCRHNKRILLQVYPDEKVYKGLILE